MTIKYVLLLCLLADLMSFSYSWWGDGGDGGKGGNAGKNGKAGHGGDGGDGWLFGDGGDGGPGGNAGKGGTPGNGGKAGKGGFFGKDGNDGEDGKNERRKIRKIERLLKSLQNDSPISSPISFLPKFNISNEIRDGKITRDEFANILKRPTMEKILFWKLDVNSDQVITCEEIKIRKLLHLVIGC